jgi:hypothetical protein
MEDGMSMMRYLMHDFFTASEFDRLDHTISQQRFAASRLTHKMRNRMQELESEVDRLTLLTHALMNVCLQKKLMTAEEIKAMVREVDLSDGVEDGKIAPRRRTR